MGAIHISIQEYFDTISETVGIKSGLLLTTEQIREILLEQFDDEFLQEKNLQYGIRIRSEVFESHIHYVRYRIGNVTQEMSSPVILFSDKLIKWAEKGIDPIPVIKVIQELFNSYKGELVEPEITIKQVQERIHAPDEMIAEIVLALGEYVFQSSAVSPPEREDWDGGTPLDKLFSCEVKGNEKQFLDQSFIDYLAANQEKLELMHWRNFERFCAEFFQRQGYEVVLGPGTNDGGVDIRAFHKTDITKPLFLIQCKRYKKDNKVDIETVKAFYTDVEFEGAQHGMIVTTSSIAEGGKKVCTARKYPLSFAENEDVKKWASSMWRHNKDLE